MRYPVEFVPEDNGTVTIYVPDIPGCHTFGEDRPQALARAIDAAEGMLAARIADGEDIPPPSDPAGRSTIAIPAISVAKLALNKAMRDAGIGGTELAKQLGWDPSQVARVLDLNEGSKFEQVEIALQALGKHIEIQILDAA